MKLPEKIALARVTVETTAPLTITTDRGDDLVDSICVTDPNGLPTLPGTSLAGVLRHATKNTDRLFGDQKGKESFRSRVHVSWAQVHDENNKPVSMAPRARASEGRSDFLTFLETGVVRDHVRLNKRGVAHDTGKYDERLVPRGARFTFELRVDQVAGGDATKELDALLSALRSKSLRVGGRTRRGYGALKVVAVRRRTFVLSRKQDKELWSELKRALEEDVSSVLNERDGSGDGPATGHAVLELKPLDYWLFGGGEPTRAAHRRPGGEVAMIPKTERAIIWSGDRGRVVDETASENLVQGTSIKGALRHRAAFHLRRIQKQWAGSDKAPKGDDEDGLEALFGKVKDAVDGIAGRVFVSDTYLATSESGPRDGTLDHVSIDRFTGAPMDGMLFREAPLYKGTLAVDLVVDTRGELDPDVRRAFWAALEDLQQGRLAVGGGSSRGHGFFEGKLLRGDELTRWLKGGA